MESNSSAARVFEGPSAVAKLASLGLAPEPLIQAAQAWDMERRNSSPLEPSVAPGFKAWAAGFRRLAELLIPRGWVKTETKGLPRVLNPRSRIAIAVVSGDEGTGRAQGRPHSKAARGKQSVFLVRSNQIQLGLPFVEGERFRALPAEVEQTTWWLLVHSDGHGTLRAELSLPIGLSDANRLVFSEDRIIIEIPELPGDRLGGSDDEEPPLAIDVPVRPRA